MRLADFIERHKEAILAEWETFAGSLLPAAGGLDAAALRDHAETILLAIAKDLRTPQTADEQEAKSKGKPIALHGAPKTAAETHALMRANQGFTIRQLFAEYRALRASVLRLWSGSNDGQATEPADIGRFNDAIDQALAESVDRYVSEVDRWRHVFLGVLGHDLRGPLNAILLTSQLLSAVGSEAPVSAHTARLVRSGERMKQLLDDLLDYSRTSLDLGIPISPRECDLTGACKEEIELLRAAWPAASIDLVTQGSGWGWWDPSRIKQVVSNLINNAVRYGDPPGTVVATLQGNVEAQVCLVVENKGSDIPRHVLGSLFDPMRRGAEREADGSTSLGLGLFIVRQIALAHGGQVDAESANGRTAFTVVLPRRGALAAQQKRTEGA
jgi:signal transduction histidine kinase